MKKMSIKECLVFGVLVLIIGMGIADNAWNQATHTSLANLIN
jgi:hypothetical protein